MEQHVSFKNIMALEPESSYTMEAQIAILKKSYHGIPVDKSMYNLTKADPTEFVAWIYREFALRLYRNPRTHELAQFLAWFANYGEDARSSVGSYIIDQNEHIYLQECLAHFRNLDISTVTSIPPYSGVNLSVKYYGPIGTSGYAIACRDIVSSLGAVLGSNTLTFVPYGVQNYGYSDDDATKALAYMSPPISKTNSDIVIIHSVPDMWPQIVRIEREMNPYVRIIGVTVWETDAVPPQWEPCLRFVDEVWTPNAWNAAVMARDVPGLVAKCITHPVLIPPPDDVHATPDEAPMLQQVRQHKERGDYVMYTINEFSGRKGIDILIRSYLSTFTSADPVVLVIKTHGSVPETVARQYIQRHTMPDSAPILLDYTRWSDNDIHKLHRLGDAFVSFTRAEGHGLGACHAALHGNHVIMTAYGGQLDYLNGIQWVPYRLVPATFCSAFDPAHAGCVGRPWCRHFPFFIPRLQRWALVSDTDAKAALRSSLDLRRRGSPETVEYIRSHFSSQATGMAFVDSIVRAYQAPPTTLPLTTNDPYDLPATVFDPQPSFDEPFVRGVRPRVLFISCAGTGNFGDDMYARIHREEMEADHEVYITHTTTYIDIEGKTRLLFQRHPPMLFDHVVIGGGGMIHANEGQSSIFQVYLPLCIEHNIPISLISIGTGESQLDPVTRNLWKDLLDYAHLVSVRSIQDADILREIMEPVRHHRLRIAPDAVFKISAPPAAVKRYVVFVPTNFMSVIFTDVADLIRRRLWENPGSQLVFLPLGGQSDPEVYPTPFVREELARFTKIFPDAIVYTGRTVNGPILETLATSVNVGSMGIATSLDDIIDIFKAAAHVITGRYHGLVAAKAFNVPFDIGTANSPKLVRESESVVDYTKWQRHYTELKEAIRETVIPARIAKDPATWSDDDRNTAIVDEVTQPKPKAWQSTIPYVQGLDNERLREKRIEAIIAQLQQNW